MPEDRDYKVTDRRGSSDEAEPAPAEPTPAPAPETPPAAEPAKAAKAGALPEIDFATFVLSMASGAFTHLHGLDDKGEPTLPPNLALAQQAIDILSLLQKKTKGNLTGEEERLLDHVLYDLRMQFVQAAASSK